MNSVVLLDELKAFTMRRTGDLPLPVQPTPEDRTPAPRAADVYVPRLPDLPGQWGLPHPPDLPGRWALPHLPVQPHLLHLSHQSAQSAQQGLLHQPDRWDQ